MVFCWAIVVEGNRNPRTPAMKADRTAEVPFLVQGSVDGIEHFAVSASSDGVDS
jgi:hypothetical protein